MKPTLALASAAALTFGAIAAESVHAILPWYATPLWLVPFLASGGPPMPTAARRTHATAALAAGWSATMLGVLFGAAPGPGAGIATHHQPAFGLHPVVEETGFPWRGIEGNGNGLAHDRIPFAMGVDALLVNFALWLAIAWLLLALVPRRHHRDLARVTTLAALLPTACGTWHLVELFD